MHKILAGIRMCLLIIVMAAIALPAMLLFKLRIIDMRLAFALRQFYCKLACAILGVRLHVSGKFEDAAGVVYLANHRSLLDPLVAFTFISNGYAISKAEVASYPLINLSARLSGVVFVDRQDAGSRRSAKEKIIELLRNLHSVIIFPEGTISTMRTAKPFRKGSIEAAVLTNRPIHYFALEMGDPVRDFWFVDGMLEQFFISFSKWRTDVYVHHFAPFIPTDTAEALSKIENDINNKLSEFQKHWKKIPAQLMANT